MIDGLDEGDVPPSWESLSLVEVCLAVSKIDPLELGRPEFKYIDIGSIETSTNSVGSPQLLKVEDAPGRARQLVRNGDSVFSTVRPYLRNIAYVDESLDGEIASTGFCVLRPNPSKVLPRFIRFFSISDNLLQQVLPLQRGVSYPAVRDKEVLQTKILVPPLGEQEKIVEILEEQLSRLDAALASVRAVREKSARFRRSLLHAAFTGALNGHNTSDGTLPEGWQLSCLGDVAKWGSGGTPKSGTSAYYGGPIKWSVIGDLTESWVTETAQTITNLGLEKSSAKLISPGTVMLAMYGASIGRTGIAAVEMATNQAIAFAVPNDGVLVAQYLLKYLQSQKDDFVRAGQGGAQPNISQTVIRPWPIPLPPLDEQMRIVEILEEQLSRLDASLAVANAIEKKASALRRSLLHAAFSGNLTKEWREAAYV